MLLRERYGALKLDILRHEAARAAAELAFRRFLEAEGVSYKVTVETLQADSGWGTSLLGGRRCELEVILAETRVGGNSIRKDAGVIKHSQVSAKRHTQMAAGQEGSDLLVFALAYVGMKRSREESVRAIDAGKPVQMAALLPDKWMHPTDWGPIGEIKLGNDSEAAILLEMVGCDKGRQVLVEEMNLAGKGLALLEGEFFSLGSLYSREAAEKPISIQLGKKSRTFSIGSHQWGNVWVYGREVVVLGYLPRNEYQRRAKVRLGARRLNGSDISSRGVRVRELRPIDDLLARSRKWARKG